MPQHLVKPPDRLLTYQEIADRYGVHKRTVRSWVAKGWLTPVRISATLVRVPESSLAEFQARREP